MRIAKAAVVCGVPAPLARELMRAYQSRGRPLKTARAVLELDEATARRVVERFCADGFLEPSQRWAGGEHQWRTTIKGNSLARARFSKPITRATAYRLLNETVSRVRVYNRDPSHLLAVGELAVFGSYLDDSVEQLGDLDLAATVYRRDCDGWRHIERTLDYAEASGRDFPMYTDRLAWPVWELVMFLKNRSTAISLTLEDLSALTGRFEVAYRISSDPDAIQLDPAAPIER